MKPRVLILLAVFVLVYALLMMVPHPPQSTLDKYNLTATSARLLNLTIIIPLAILWFTAFYGFVKLDAYQRLIGYAKDGMQVAKLRNGILILALTLPLTSILNQVLDLWTISNPAAEATSTIIHNYVGIFFPLLAFIYIGRGAYGLAALTRKRTSYQMLNLIFLLALALGFTYVYLIARAPGSIADNYHLSLALFLFTIILPYTYVWFLGLYAAYQIYLYSRNVKGLVYRQSWRLLSFGLVAIIIFSILLQYLGTLSEQLQGLSLNWILLIVYLLLFLWAISYVLVALGAKRLMKIEEA